MPPPTTKTGSRFSFALITLYSSVGVSRGRGVKRTCGRDLRYLDHLAARVPERSHLTVGRTARLPGQLAAGLRPSPRQFRPQLRDFRPQALDRGEDRRGLLLNHFPLDLALLGIRLARFLLHGVDH